MHSLLEGLIAGLAALGVGLIGKYRGWSPLQGRRSRNDRVCRSRGTEANR